MIQNKASAYWDFRSGHIADLVGSLNGTFVSAPYFSKDGLYFDGIDDAIDIGDTGLTIKSVIFLLEARTTTEDIADFDGGTHTLETSGGTLTATGFSTPTLYVDGLAGSTVTTQTRMVGATTATGFAADNFDIGKETGYFEGVIKAVALSTSEWSATEMAALYAELENTVWPTSPTAKSEASIEVNPNDSESQGGEIEVLNSDFSSLGGGGIEVFADWTNTSAAGVTFSQVGNACRMESDGTFCVIVQNICETGKKYLCRFTVTDVTAGAIRVNNDNAGTTFNSTGDKELVFVANSSAFGIKRSSGATDVTFTDIELYEYNGLVAGYNMKPVAGKIIDQSSNGYDGTITGATYENHLLGDALRFHNGTDNIDFGAVDLFGTGDITVSFWCRIDSYGGGAASRVFANGKFIVMLYDVSDQVAVSSDGGATYLLGTANSLKTDRLYNVIVDRAFDGTAHIFINNEAAGTGATGTPVAATSNSFIGNNTVKNRGVDGILIQPQIFNKILSASEREMIYNQGKPALWKTDWGTPVSSANVTTGQLEDTPFQVNSSGAQISSTTINGTDVKAIKNIGTGNLVAPTSALGQTPTESLRGKWEFWMNLATPYSAQTYFILGQGDWILGDITSVNNYNLTMSQSNGGIILRKGITSIDSDTGLFSADTWHKVTWTISCAGLMKVYIDDNEVLSGTDTTYTTATHFGFRMLTANSMVAYSDVGGNYSITKSLTA